MLMLAKVDRFANHMEKGKIQYWMIYKITYWGLGALDDMLNY